MVTYSYPAPGAPGAQAPQSGIAPTGDFSAAVWQPASAARTSWRVAVSSSPGRRVSHFPAASSVGVGGGR